MPRHAQQYAGDPDGDAAPRNVFTASRRNFLALVFCLIGTAALPHILMRNYTTPSVKQARESVTWSLLLIRGALRHRAGACGAGQVRSVQRAGRPAPEPAAGLDRRTGPGSMRRLVSVTDINLDGVS